MTRQRPRFDEQSRPSSRRSGFIPGRRFALVATLACAVVAGWGADAVADDSTVVTATVYEGGGGGTSSKSVTVDQLSTCTTYAGASPIALYPSSSFQPTPDSWSLGTVISCGLSIALSNVDNVQVDGTSGALESPLSSGQLSDPSQWPAGSGALPVISHDGGEDINTYVRPWEGGSDQNGADEVVQSQAPVAIVVTENGASLTVQAASQAQSSTSFSFSATAARPDGTPVPTGNLSYSWNFDDGSPPSTSAAPTHSFQPGVYSVTVQVTDTADGLAGTAHTDVTVASSPTGGSGPTQTGGTPTSPGKTPTGPSHSKGTKPGTKPGKSSGSSGTGHSGSSATKGSATAGASSGTASAAPTTSAGASTSSSAPGKSATAAPRHAAPTKRHRAPATGAASNVSGRLISDVIPLPAAVSPLVHAVPGSAATAPAVRRAITGSTSPWSGIGAGLAVLLLFGLGARRELRWRGLLPG